MSKKVGIWIRVSTTTQVDTDSHIHQEMRLKDFIKNRGWKVVKIYRLKALSGKSVMDYNETQRMLSDIKSGVISGLAFYKISRLARNTKELIEISEIFEQHKADLVSMDMSIDTSTPIGRHFFRTMSSMAQWERETIVDRINASIQNRAELGTSLGGRPPYGYQYKDKRLIINEEESHIVTLIYTLFLEQKRKKTVARMLNDNGYRGRDDKDFSGVTINRVLTDPVYKGLRRMNHYGTDADGKRIIKPKELWVFHEVDPIILEKQWDEVNDIIHQQSITRKQPLNRKVYLFTGFLWCHCGTKMYTYKRTKNYHCKNHCGNRINKEDIEEVFRNELLHYTISPSEINDYTSRLQTIFKGKQNEYEALQQEYKKVSNKIEKLLDLHLNEKIPTEAFETYHAKPYERKLQLEEHLLLLEQELKLYSENENSASDIIKKAQSLYEGWYKLSRDEKRDIVDTITKKITVSEQEVSISLYKVVPNDNSLSFLESLPNGEHNQLVCSSS